MSSTADLPSLSADVYVGQFLAWCIAQGLVGRLDWHRIVILSQEFAEVHEFAAPTEMSLAKALSRTELRRGYRYLRSDEPGYRAQTRRGCQRPRALWHEIPHDLPLPIAAQRCSAA